MEKNKKYNVSPFDKNKYVGWIVWGLLTIFYAYQFILRVLPNIMLHDIMNQFNIKSDIFSQFTGIYYIGYSLAHIPIGIMIDRLGPKKAMTICILLSVIGMIPLLFNIDVTFPILGRLIVGIGSSGAALGLFNVIHLIFNDKMYSRMLSISVTCGLIGAIYGGAPVKLLCDNIGYKNTLKIFIAGGILLALASYIIIPDIRREKNISIFQNIKDILSNKLVVLSCICAGLLVGPLEGFADAWGTEFIKKLYDIKVTYSASLCSLIYIGMCIGGPLLSLIAEKTGHYIRTIFVAGSLMALVFISILTRLIPINLLGPAFILVGICCGYQILAIYKISTYVNKNIAGLTNTITNMIIMIFGYAFHSFIGIATNISGGIHDINAFSIGIMIIPIALIFGSVGFILLKK